MRLDFGKLHEILYHHDFEKKRESDDLRTTEPSILVIIFWSFMGLYV